MCLRFMKKESLDASVYIETGYGMEGPGSISDSTIFIFFTGSDWLWELTSFLSSGYHDAFSSGNKTTWA
jgi:hypothetical protein